MDRVIAIGGSAGAIGAIQALCDTLDNDIPAAICIVVHVGARGTNQIAQVFGDRCPIPVETAVDGQKLEVGRAYVAAADHHLIVLDDTIRLGRGPRENLARPAIDPLFRSVGLSHGSGAMGRAHGYAERRRGWPRGFEALWGHDGRAKSDRGDGPRHPLAALAASDVDYQTPIAELGALLKMLASEPRKAAPPPPEDIRLEVDIALGRPVGTEDTNRIGNPVALSCPGCGGVLSQMRKSPPLRFRCQVGRAYTADTLATEQEGSVDEALRVALRIAEERATLTHKMAKEAIATACASPRRLSRKRQTRAASMSRCCAVLSDEKRGKRHLRRDWRQSP